MTNDYAVLIPSFSVERKTKALTTWVWGLTAFIYLFISIFISMTHLVLIVILEVIRSFFYNNMVTMWPIICSSLVASILLGRALLSLQTAYVIQPDKIIKGRIKNNAVAVTGSSLATQAALTAYMAANLTNPSHVSGANSINNSMVVFKMISLNMREGFAQKFFFTEAYKRKEYLNPQLIKESKRSYTYLCGKRKIKIPKIYTGMDCGVQNAKEVSVFKRVVVRLLLLTAITITVFTADLAAGLASNPTYLSHITQSAAKIEASLSDFGYQIQWHNNTVYRFEKAASEKRDSHIRYIFHTDGSIKDVTMEIYFNKSSQRVAEEIECILTSLDDGITQQQMDEFIAATQSTIEGEYEYTKLYSNNYTVTLGTSDGHAHVYIW